MIDLTCFFKHILSKLFFYFFGSFLLESPFFLPLPPPPDLPADARVLGGDMLELDLAGAAGTEEAEAAGLGLVVAAVVVVFVEADGSV